jgi:Flp pilus assembly protein TadG
MKKTHAQSLVEFALILPLFLLLVLGIFDLGRVIYHYSTIHNAAREGARYGAVHHCDTAGIVNRTQTTAAGLSSTLTVNVTTDFTPDGQPDQIIVTTITNFQTVTPLVGVFLGEGGSLSLSSQARGFIEMRTPCP